MLSTLKLALLYHKKLLLPPRTEHLPLLHPTKGVEDLICIFSPSYPEPVLTLQHGGLSAGRSSTQSLGLALLLSAW